MRLSADLFPVAGGTAGPAPAIPVAGGGRNRRKTRRLNRAKVAARVLREHLAGTRELDPSQIASYKKTVKWESRRSFYFFAREVLNFSLLTPQTHRRWCDKLQRDIFEFDYIARLKPRKTYKTTIYGEAFILWLWGCISPELHIFYTSANLSLLEEVSQHLDYFLAPGNSSLYSFVFGVERLPRNDRAKNTWAVFNINGKDRSAKGNSLAFRTAGGATNGLHPHIIICDDPMDLQDRESKAVRQKKTHWWDSLEPLQHEYDLFAHLQQEDPEFLDFLTRAEATGGARWPGDWLGKATNPEKLRNFKIRMLITTRWHMNDLVSHLIEKNPDLHPEDRFDIEIEGVYKPDGSLQYPEFFTEEKIRGIKSRIDAVFFACQYLNDPLPDGLVIFDVSKMHYFDMESIRLEDAAISCFLDPSKGKDGGDFPAVWWVASLNGRLYFIEAAHPQGEMRSLADTIHLAALKNKQYGAVQIFFEGNGTNLVGEGIEKAHEEIGYSIPVTEFISRGNKENRIQAMQPALYRGDGLFRRDWQTAYPEPFNHIKFFPAWGFDDYSDLAAAALNQFAQGAIKIHVPARIAQNYIDQPGVTGQQVLERRRRKFQKMGF